MGVKISLDEITKRMYNVFGNKYEFDFSNFVNTHSKIGVKCSIHGWSQQTIKNLFNGHGCRKCSYKIISDKQKNDLKYILNKFRIVHNDKYDYSKFIYSKNRNNSIIICPIHGEFYQSAWTHSKGHGCPSCSNNKRLNNTKFISAANKVHNRNYIYDFVDYKNMHSDIKIICPIHGEFIQKAQTHIKGAGCPKCNQSKGERMIEICLNKNNIKYIYQKKFSDCKYISHLVFDFYLPEFNTCIEFNGMQHYYPIDIFGGIDNLKITQKRDKIKEDYCIENNIKLIIIKQDKKHIDIDSVGSQINNVINSITKSI